MPSIAPTNPYTGLAPDQWADKTKRLVAAHPLSTDELVSVTLSSWKAIFASTLGGYTIGSQIKPKPQIMGFFLSELIALEFASLYPNIWRPDQSASDKDMVYLPDQRYSVEIKASSDSRGVFGNQSYAQSGGADTRKEKSGYYLAINFQKFTSGSVQPEITKIRFGWLDQTDWIGQTAQTGQQAYIPAETRNAKLLQLYP